MDDAEKLKFIEERKKSKRCIECDDKFEYSWKFSQFPEWPTIPYCNVHGPLAEIRRQHGIG